VLILTKTLVITTNTHPGISFISVINVTHRKLISLPNLQMIKNLNKNSLTSITFSQSLSTFMLVKINSIQLGVVISNLLNLFWELNHLQRKQI